MELKRTKIYYVDTSIDIRNLKIIDTIHQQQKKIEAKLNEYNYTVENVNESTLMMPYPGFGNSNFLLENCDCKRDIANEEDTDIVLNGWTLKNNTEQKKYSQVLTKHLSDVETVIRPQAFKLLTLFLKNVIH